MVDTWKYRHLEVNSLSDTAVSKRASRHMTTAPAASSKRLSTGRTFHHEGLGAPPGPVRLRRSVSNPTDIIKSLHADSKIKQINKQRRSSSGHIDPRSLGAPFVMSRSSSGNIGTGSGGTRNVDRPVVKTDEASLTDLSRWEDSTSLKGVELSPKAQGGAAAGVVGVGGGAAEDNVYERTRVFEYDDDGNLVEVFDDQEGEKTQEEDDYEYDEEYIEVIYEGDDDGNDFDENEIHIVMDDAEEEEDVASHITWL
jgi:hypothetical protein